MAKNPCKAAWNLVSQTYKEKQTMKCSASPDDFNWYLLGEVEKIVNSVAIDGDSGPKHQTLNIRYPAKVQCFSSWTKVTPELNEAY